MSPLSATPRRPAVRTAALLGICSLTVALGCERAPPPGAGKDSPASSEPVGGVGTPIVPAELTPPPSTPATPGPAASAPPPAHTGPYLLVTDSSAGVYADTALEKKGKFGYLRSGGKVPVHEGTVTKDNCPRGWYRLRDGGFVCGNVGTTKPTSPEARFATRAPDPEAVLPYTYARNAKNGTPLYKSVPTAEQMRAYEPYLVKKAEPDAATSKKEPDGTSAPPPAKAELGGTKATEPGVLGGKKDNSVDPETAPAPFSREAMESARLRAEGATTAMVAASTLLPAAGARTEPVSPDAGVDERPWWQRDDADERLHEVKLDALSADADDILARRMVKGFYVAVDREFAWNGRPWYKTTKGLVTPADRFWVTKGSEFQGIQLDGTEKSLPIGFPVGAAKGRPTYRLSAEGKLLPEGTIAHRTPVPLTGVEKELAGKRYVETRAGTFMLATHLRITKPGPPPAGILPDERWIDVSLDTQTLVAFEGTRPVYATLISSGKESKVKEKDHRTPTGEWRVREKHVTTTMDGDGSAAGDLPYSIDDVPYVMYYHRAFALHGAFWHSNYGSQMSHGCVNLSPLDAKWVFRFTEPHLPEGWHGVWATEAHPGSRVVVHE